MKKYFVLSLCFLLSTGMLFANGDKEESNSLENSKEGKPTVVMIFPGINDQDTVNPLTGIMTPGLDKFEAVVNAEIPDVNVDIVSIPWDGWIQKLEAMMTSGETDIGFYTNQVAVPDWFVDLTPYLEKDSDMNLDNLDDIFINPAVASLQYKSFNYPEATNNIYGMPISISSYDMVYDKVLFDQWGMDYPDENTTMPELVELAQKMTGKNPVTGKQNYGAFAPPYWMEWLSICYDAVKPMHNDNMDINLLDMDTYINYVKDSPEILSYFEDMATIVACSPKGVSTGSGSESFFTEANNIAINFNTCGPASELIGDMFGGIDDITDRFIILKIPSGPKSGMQGFPEFSKIGISQKATNPDASWEVIKTFITNKTIINYYLDHYLLDKLPALKDTNGFNTLDYAVNKDRLEYQTKTGFITDDYWTWRISLQKVNAEIVSQSITPEEARLQLHEYMVKWVNNTKSQLGN